MKNGSKGGGGTHFGGNVAVDGVGVRPLEHLAGLLVVTPLNFAKEIAIDH